MKNWPIFAWFHVKSVNIRKSGKRTSLKLMWTLISWNAWIFRELEFTDILTFQNRNNKVLFAIDSITATAARRAILGETAWKVGRASLLGGRHKKWLHYGEFIWHVPLFRSWIFLSMLGVPLILAPLLFFRELLRGQKKHFRRKIVVRLKTAEIQMYNVRREMAKNGRIKGLDENLILKGKVQ